MELNSKRRLLGAALAGSALLGKKAFAQPAGWPSRTIQVVVGAPAGGGVDTGARRLADRMGALLGGTVVVLNRPGAAGLLGAQVVSTAAPDGYTLGYLHSGHLILQAIEGKPNVGADFTPITMFSASQFCIAVAPDSPYRSLADLLDDIEKRPGKLNYGAGGNGSPGHVAFEKLRSLRAGLDVVQIPFKGAIESALAVAQKEIDFVSGVFSTVLPIARNGKLRILAVTGSQRSPQLPDVPTVAEAAKIPNYQFVSWGALFGPARMPTTLVTKLDAAIRGAASEPAFRKYLDESGGQLMLSDSPKALATMVNSELNETIALMKKLGLRKA